MKRINWEQEKAERKDHIIATVVWLAYLIFGITLVVLTEDKAMFSGCILIAISLAGFVREILTYKYKIRK